MPDIAERLKSVPADTLTALAFFSRIPVRPAPASFDLRQSAGAWPVAGLLLAIVPAILFAVASALKLPPVVSALLALAAMAVLTGGMHEDGLADTADGFGGGANREDRLILMRDSRLGTYGALALVFVIVLKAVALGSIGLSPGRAALAVVAVAVISRALALWHWSATGPARAEGMAVSAGRPDAASLTVGLVAGAVALVVLVPTFRLAALFAILLAAVAIMLFSRLTEHQIGGHTGDTIGAAQQIAETLLLAGLTSGATYVFP